MEIAEKTDEVGGNSSMHAELVPTTQQHKDDAAGQLQQQQQLQKTKRKHRRGKPKAKNINKPYKQANWKFQVPRQNYNNKGGANNRSGGSRAKLTRSNSLAPYNTNKFLMEEHLAEVPSALLTPSGRTRDSSFSVDSEDNYFFSLPEDEEEFLTKEFANVYEKARVERLENLTKQQLIEECLQIEDRYSTDQGTQRQQQLNVQRISAEFMSKIRALEEKLREVSRENYNLRCQLMRSAAAAASPPSAAAPTGAACQPIPMDSTSEDSESDSSSSSSSSSAADRSVDDAGQSDAEPNEVEKRRQLCRRSSSRSSLSEYNAYIENNYVGNGENGQHNIDDDIKEAGGDDCIDYERQQLLDGHMDDDDDEDSNPTAANGELVNSERSPITETANEQEKKIQESGAGLLNSTPISRP